MSKRDEYHNNDIHLYIKSDRIIINKECRSGYESWGSKVIMNIGATVELRGVISEIIEKANKYDEIKRLLK